MSSEYHSEWPLEEPHITSVLLGVATRGATCHMCATEWSPGAPRVTGGLSCPLVRDLTTTSDVDGLWPVLPACVPIQGQPQSHSL